MYHIVRTQVGTFLQYLGTALAFRPQPASLASQSPGKSFGSRKESKWHSDRDHHRADEPTASPVGLALHLPRVPSWRAATSLGILSPASTQTYLA
eukprot:COSAG06_NODE_24528_length_660_cov_0.668449_1_plen_94_part_10